MVPACTTSKENKATFITKRIIHKDIIGSSKHELFKTRWDDIENDKKINDA